MEKNTVDSRSVTNFISSFIVICAVIVMVGLFIVVSYATKKSIVAAEKQAYTMIDRSQRILDDIDTEVMTNSAGQYRIIQQRLGHMRSTLKGQRTDYNAIHDLAAQYSILTGPLSIDRERTLHHITQAKKAYPTIVNTYFALHTTMIQNYDETRAKELGVTLPDMFMILRLRITLERIMAIEDQAAQLGAFPNTQAAVNIKIAQSSGLLDKLEDVYADSRLQLDNSTRFDAEAQAPYYQKMGEQWDAIDALIAQMHDIIADPKDHNN